jgi:hypothetical protein
VVTTVAIVVGELLRQFAYAAVIVYVYVPAATPVKVHDVVVPGMLAPHVPPLPLPPVLHSST